MCNPSIYFSDFEWLAREVGTKFASYSLALKKNTIVKCELFIATQNDKLGDVCKDIWHVPTRDGQGSQFSQWFSGQTKTLVRRHLNCR